MMDRQALRYFLAVIDAGGFTRGAAACNVSQPTLSSGIARLERSVGATLFVRGPRRVALTEAGARLAGHARRIEAGFLRAEREAAAGTGTRVRIGLVTTLPLAWIEAIAVACRGQQVELVEGRARDLAEKLARGRIDLALTVLPDGPTGDARPLFDEGFALALAADHPLAGRAEIAPEELAAEPMIVRRHCERLAETSRHFIAHGVRPLFPARTAEEPRALAYVRAGLGLTVAPDSFGGPGLARPRLGGFSARRTVGLAFAAESDPGSAVAEALAAQVAGLVRGRPWK